MADIDLGSALTGEDPNSAAAKWDDFMQRPGNRQALLQIGLQMMQPVGIGQTTGGHIAQAIGSGGEAVDRGSNLDLKEYMADSKLADADARLGMAQQSLDLNERRANAYAESQRNKGGPGGLTAAFQERARRQDAWRNDQRIVKDADRIQKRLDDVRKEKAFMPNTPTPPDLVPYEGMDIDQIRDALKKKRAAAPPSVGDDAAPSDDDTPAAMPMTPPEPGARLGRNARGQPAWYKPDPQRPGKFLEIQ